MSNNFRTVGVPIALDELITEIARAEDRKKYVVVSRAVELYRRRHSESELGQK
ncbi:hypothetical protein [Mycobacterium paraense]|uniref:hypothetical protein n=1 Tax=Mycobacterium paraense TaxID=767916 RepID=UPI001482D32E|nr:hypothetical protein [Mycobacterium paraense]